MYIEPQTNIKILSGCPIDRDYINTLYFSSESQQRAYFNTLVKYNLTNYSYQRRSNGVCRVSIKNENLFDCDYMMFQNTAFGDKWFYAFIDRTEYINNGTTEIYFTLDPLQTWFFDFEFNECFVEREHSATDEFGENIIDENISVNEYIVNDVINPSQWNNKSEVIIIASTDWWSGTIDNPVWHNGSRTSDIYGGVFNGVHFEIKGYDKSRGEIFAQAVARANDYLYQFSVAGKNDSILGVWQSYDIYTIQNAGYYDHIYTEKPNTLQGYIPKNKKLLTYPFAFLEGFTPKGDRRIYRAEFFNDSDDITFTVRASFNGVVNLGLVPISYKGSGDGGYFDDMMSYDGASIPCAYTTDFFKAWLAQNSFDIGGEKIPYGIVNGLSALYPGYKQPSKSMTHTIETKGQTTPAFYDPNQTTREYTSVHQTEGGLNAPSIGSSLGILMSTLEGVNTSTIKSNQGVMGGGNAINYLFDIDTFKIFKKTIPSYIAKTIDDYFSRYGYATKRMKTPNISSRPHWNFIKTIGCSIKGSLPTDDESIIQNIFDNGITFWKNGSEVGNYSLDNSPVTT